MMLPDEDQVCDLEPLISSEQELQRVQTLEELGFLAPGSVPIFEEATQTAAHFLNLPICVLSILDCDRVWFKSAVGLSRIGLMNNLATSRQLPRRDAFCAKVIERQRVLQITDAAADPAFAQTILVQRYGISAYLGVPLLAANGCCVGTLAVMGLSPRTFSEQEIAFLELMARWAMSEFERNRLQQQQVSLTAMPLKADSLPASDAAMRNSVKTELLSQMAQELCTPLTSILGMAKVLNQGIYGPLSRKQQEYTQIIHTSGQYMLSLVNEMVDLGALNDQSARLNLTAIDIEMLCQQAISPLNQPALRRDQQIQLTVEPGNRIWLLDKEKVRQMLYHLVFSVIQASSSDSIIRIHVSRKQSALHLSVWSSHPWLGEGLPQIASTPQIHAGLAMAGTDQKGGFRRKTWSDSLSTSLSDGLTEDLPPNLEASQPEVAQSGFMPSEPTQPEYSRQSLGLLLSQQLAELHSGSLLIQGSVEEGYRYVIQLPQLKASAEESSSV